MSEDLSQRRCSVYPDRPAVARCPECRDYFSRECIVEHEGRLICATCIGKLTRADAAAGKEGWLPAVPAMQVALAGAAVWLLYYALARLLILIPSEFHEGSIWSK